MEGDNSRIYNINIDFSNCKLSHDERKNVDEHEYNIPTKLMEDVYTTDCENFPCGYFPK